MRLRDHLGLAPGDSFGHFGQTYIPTGDGSINMFDPSVDDRAPDSQTAQYNLERDTITFGKRSGKMYEVPAVRFMAKHRGNFWGHRRRRLLELDRRLRCGGRDGWRGWEDGRFSNREGKEGEGGYR